MSTETSPSLNRGSIAAFREDLILQGQSERTAKAYGSDLNLLLEARGGSRAFGLPHEALDGAAKVWLLANKDNWSAATKRRRIAAVRAYARHHGIGSVLAGYKMPRPAKVGPRHLPNLHADLDRILMAADKKPVAQFVIATCGSMGLRIHEACRLAPQDLDLSDSTLRVRGKGEHERKVPIPSKYSPYIVPIMVLYATSGPDEAIIQHDLGTARRWVNRYARRAGLGQVSSHDLRHTAAQVWLEGGADIRTVQELLGHQNVTTTEVYTSTSMAKMREAVES